MTISPRVASHPRRRDRKPRSLLLIWCLLALAACGGESSAPPASPDDASEAVDIGDTSGEPSRDAEARPDDDTDSAGTERDADIDSSATDLDVEDPRDAIPADAGAGDIEGVDVSTADAPVDSPTDDASSASDSHETDAPVVDALDVGPSDDVPPDDADSADAPEDARDAGAGDVLSDGSGVHDGGEDAEGDAPPPDAGRACSEGESRFTRVDCSDRTELVRCPCIEGRLVCDADPIRVCRDSRCDDESELVCELSAPTCPDRYIAAIVEGCWQCRSEEDCEPSPGPPSCEEVRGTCSEEPSGCPDGTYRSAAVCDAAVDCCVPVPVTCSALGGACYPQELECPAGFETDPDDESCPARSQCCSRIEEPSPCDDASDLVCDLDLVCGPYETRAVREGCYTCLNPDTCVPWGESSCADDGDCAAGERCDLCGSSSCPFCEDCIAACVPDT